MSSNICK